MTVRGGGNNHDWPAGRRFGISQSLQVYWDLTSTDGALRILVLLHLCAGLQPARIRNPVCIF